MAREELLANIAPCSLLCYTCSAFEKGAVCRLSRELSGYLEGVAEFYEKHSPPEGAEGLERFRIFREELDRLGSMGCCGGCRGGGHNECSIRGCFINECVKEHGVDFCGECAAFPCDRAGTIFEDEVYRQWLEGNKEIRELGAERYWEKNRTLSHYRSYLRPGGTGR